MTITIEEALELSRLAMDGTIVKDACDLAISLHAELERSMLVQENLAANVNTGLGEISRLKARMAKMENALWEKHRQMDYPDLPPACLFVKRRWVYDPTDKEHLLFEEIEEPSKFDQNTVEFVRTGFFLCTPK